MGILFILGGVGGVVDAAMHPASDWAQADRNKSFWIILMFFLGIIGAVVYIVAVRSRFNSGASSNPFLK